MNRFVFILLSFFLANFCFSQRADFYNLYFAGNSLLMKEQYDKAIAKYNEALKIYTTDYVYCNRGNAYYKKKDYSNALADYNKTLQLNDEYAEAYYQRALTKYFMGDKNGCCDDLKKAEKLKLSIASAAAKEYCR